jgi:hypothetical protein
LRNRPHSSVVDCAIDTLASGRPGQPGRTSDGA